MKISPTQIKLMQKMAARESHAKTLDYKADRAIDPNYQPSEGDLAYPTHGRDVLSLAALFRTGLIRCAVSRVTGEKMPMHLLTEAGKNFLKTV